VTVLDAPGRQRSSTALPFLTGEVDTSDPVAAPGDGEHAVEARRDVEVEQQPRSRALAAALPSPRQTATRDDGIANVDARQVPCRRGGPVVASPAPVSCICRLDPPTRLFVAPYHPVLLSRTPPDPAPAFVFVRHAVPPRLALDPSQLDDSMILPGAGRSLIAVRGRGAVELCPVWTRSVVSKGRRRRRGRTGYRRRGGCRGGCWRSGG
jgi:hypothetical protein